MQRRTGIEPDIADGITRKNGGSWSASAMFCLVASLAALQSGCLRGDKPVPITQGSASTSGGTSSSSNTGSSTDTSVIESFEEAEAVKVIFNKKSFYNNQSPNALGCAGDAKNYYHPLTDRIVPVKPKWVKNIAVELTNSNAFDGPSFASACALSGDGSPEAKNCASFDDLQPLRGDQSRAILIGGYGCISPSETCVSDSNLLGPTNAIWSVSTPDDTSSALWIKQSGGVPVTSDTAGATSGLVWHGGDYDEIHDQFYTYGGSTPNTSSANGVMTFSNKVVRMTFNTDRTLSTTFPPVQLTPSTRSVYGGWTSADITAELTARSVNVPPKLVGPTFTYGLRRDSSMKTQCLETDGTACDSDATTVSIGNKVLSYSEHSDYFLLLGGLIGQTQGDFTLGQFSNHIYAYKPHGFSADGLSAPADGDWILLSNVTATAPNQIASKIMAISTIEESATGSTTQPFDINVTGVTWTGRGYHQTVYDPTMNRFYIFGGVENTGGVSAFTTAPSLADTDVWVYDPPATGRRPTSTCFTSTTPDGTTLPVSNVLGGETALGVNREYIASKVVFPPGGCLQRMKITSTTEPDGRFAHSMAFDRDNKAMLVFGGCDTPAVVTADGTTTAGSPLGGCASTAMLNDTWIYLPPTVTEVVSKDYVETAVTNSPFSSASLLPNIFGTDFWIDRLALFLADNSPSSGDLTTPTTDEALGVWLTLNPPIKPTKRVGGALYYDRAHHKFFLQGGYGCIDSSCSAIHTLNDMWEFTPPDIASQCDRTTGTCSSTCIASSGVCTDQGIWKQIRAHKPEETGQPTPVVGARVAYAEPMFNFGDDFYTVTDSACINQGPIATNDSSINKRQVGAIYVDVDRDFIGTAKNVLLNLRFLPFDRNTKGPGYYDNNTPFVTVDDSDSSSSNDEAIIRVQLLANPLRFGDQIQALIQPRYHQFISGATVVADTFMHVSGATGQITEKQIHVPLSFDSTVNLIKIERVQGSVKFYELTISKF